MDVNFLVLLIAAVVVTVGYGVVGYVSTLVGENPEPFKPKKLLVTFVYSIVVGLLGVFTGVLTLENLSDPAVVAAVFATYTGLTYYVNKIVDIIWKSGPGEKQSLGSR